MRTKDDAHKMKTRPEKTGTRHGDEEHMRRETEQTKLWIDLTV